MNIEDVKAKMMGLWKKTFHDSPEYITMVFDEYFEEKTIAYIEEDNDIVSALLGIPYQFHKNGKNIKGLYLCGLATQPKYRNRGYMRTLIDEINEKAKKLGFAFTFLIPANDLLINYYIHNKYVKGIYRIEDRYSDIHNFINDYTTSLNNEDEKIRNLKLKIFDKIRCIELNNSDEHMKEKIVSFIENIEGASKGYASLIHTSKDVKNIIRDNEICNGKVIISLSQNDEISGVGFCIIDKENRVIVQRIFTSNSQSYYKILNHIKNIFPSSPISIYKFPEETNRKGIESVYYGAPNKEGMMLGGEYGVVERVYNVKSHAKTYGMIRILDIAEILKFLVNDRRDLKFSILIKKEENDEKTIKCNVENGKVDLKEIRESEDKTNQNLLYNQTVLTKKQFSKLIFRKPDNGSALMEAFGIPRLPINICLMLD